MIRPIEEVNWFHSLTLDDQTVTKGKKSADVLKQEADIIFRHGVQGKSVLDVGAWDGFFSFEAERRGAARVLATDHFCWSGGGWGNKDGFDTAHDRLKSRVEALDIDAMEITPEVVGQFDTVLFLGVLYHLRHPFLGLEKMSALTKEVLVVETLMDLVDLPQPAGAFYPGKQKLGDPTNWWGLNAPAVAAMLNDLGFPLVEYVLHPMSHPSNIDSMRGIFHAYRKG